MSKHFKSKKKIRHDLLVKFIILIIIIYIMIKMISFLFIKLPIIDTTFNHHKIRYYKNYIINNTINNPKVLLGYYINNDVIENNNYNDNLLYVMNEKEEVRPLVYIYNTHQKEAYIGGKSVLDASLYIKELFLKSNIDTIVEKRDITEFMRVNNINYSYSYYASKYYIKDIMSKNTIDLFIDLHRDSLDKNSSTLDGKYAKILFVVGGENKNYKVNYKLANDINNKIKNKYPKLTRGVILKSGKGVNGVYNQDLSPNMILLEVGGNNNNFDEVKNTLNLIVPIIGEYLYEKRTSI